MRLGQMKSNRKSLPSKFPRHDPEADLELVEQALFEEMEGAAELLQSEEDFGRSGVRHALHACYSFLHVRGLSGQALKPLSRSHCSLGECGRRCLTRDLRSETAAAPDSGTKVVPIGRFPRNQALCCRLHGCVDEAWRFESSSGGACCKTCQWVATCLSRRDQEEHGRELARRTDAKRLKRC